MSMLKWLPANCGGAVGRLLTVPQPIVQWPALSLRNRSVRGPKATPAEFRKGFISLGWDRKGRGMANFCSLNHFRRRPNREWLWKGFALGSLFRFRNSDRPAS